MTLHFTKMQATGNDFVMLDGIGGTLPELTPKLISSMCDRRFGIGADGVLVLAPSSDFDFRMIYFNADGLEVDMCGNGARALVEFAFRCGIKKDHYEFQAADGVHLANRVKPGTINLRMIKPGTVSSFSEHEATYFAVNTGVPHVLRNCRDVTSESLLDEGQRIRYAERFHPQGCNFNLVSITGEHHLALRTYERGVEAETLSCGTGAVAAAVWYRSQTQLESPVEVHVPGGDLRISFDQEGYPWLEGPASIVFDGDFFFGKID